MCKVNARPFEYAFLLDALKNEQAQGITIDTARCFFNTAQRHYIIIDAPGHVEFLKNMITGAARAEAALLVIDAQRGRARELPAPRLHPLDARHPPDRVLVNKMDLVDWDQAKFEAIVDRVRRLPRRGSACTPPASSRSARATATTSSRAPPRRPGTTGRRCSTRSRTSSGSTTTSTGRSACRCRTSTSSPRRSDDRRIFVGTIETGPRPPRRRRRLPAVAQALDGQDDRGALGPAAGRGLRRAGHGPHARHAGVRQARRADGPRRPAGAADRDAPARQHLLDEHGAARARAPVRAAHGRRPRRRRARVRAQRARRAGAGVGHRRRPGRAARRRRGHPPRRAPGGVRRRRHARAHLALRHRARARHRRLRHRAGGPGGRGARRRHRPPLPPRRRHRAGARGALRARRQGDRLRRRVGRGRARHRRARGAQHLRARRALLLPERHRPRRPQGRARPRGAPRPRRRDRLGDDRRRHRAGRGARATWTASTSTACGAWRRRTRCTWWASTPAPRSAPTSSSRRPRPPTTAAEEALRALAAAGVLPATD